MEIEVPAYLTSQGGHVNKINFKGAVSTQDDVKTKKNLISQMYDMTYYWGHFVDSVLHMRVCVGL